MVPTQIKPSSTLTTVVHIMRVTDPVQLGVSFGGGPRTIMVTLHLMRGDNSIQSVSRDIVVGQSQEIGISVPKHLGVSAHHPYSLKIIGEDLFRVDPVVFEQQAHLDIWKPEHIIDVDLPYKLFRSGQTVTATVSVHQTDQKTYQGPAYVSLLNPHGHLVYNKMLQIRGPTTKHFTSVVHQKMYERLLSSGNIFSYKLADHTVTGPWTMIVSTELQKSNLTFFVTAPAPHRVDVLVALPPTVSLSDPTLTGSITANFTHNSLPVCGNLTISATVMNGRNEILFSQVETQFYHFPNLIKTLAQQKSASKQLLDTLAVKMLASVDIN